MKTISVKAQYYVIPMKIRFFFCLHSPPTPVSGQSHFYRATEQSGSDITFVVSHYGHVRYGLLSLFLFYIT